MATKHRDQGRQRIALERVAILFSQAEAVFREHPDWSDRYVERARRIAMRARIRIPKEFRRRFCRRCNAFLVPGVNARVRISRGRVLVTCTRCGYQKRYRVVRPDKREKADS